MSHFVNTERQLLLAAINGSDKVFEAESYGLSEHCFKSDDHREIWRAITSLKADGYPVEMQAVYSRLESINAQNILAMMTGDKPPANPDFYIESVITAHDSETSAKEIIELCNKLSTTTDFRLSTKIKNEIREKLEDNPLEVFERDRPKPLPELVDEWYADLLRENQEAKKGVIAGIKSGIDDLDSFLHGWKKSRLYVVGARSGVGKTTLAVNFTFRALMDKKRVAFFSSEMTDKEILEKVIARASKADVSHMRLGISSQAIDKAVKYGAELIKGSKFFPNHRTGKLYTRLEQEIRRYKKRENIELVIVDYIQLFDAGEKMGKTSRNLQIAHMTAGLKQLTMELDIPIIILSQLNRNLENENREPIMSDLRDSGSIEQDADAILLIGKSPHDDEGRYIKLVKNRYGRAPLKFEIKTNLAQSYMGD